MLDGIPGSTAYALITRDRATWEARFAARKDTSRDVGQFQERAARITSAEDLLKDYRTLQFVLTAFGLEGEIGKTAILRKLLTEDPTAEASFANRMSDPRYRAFADAMAEWLPSEAVRARVAGTIGAGYQLLDPAMTEAQAREFRTQLAAAGTADALLADRALADRTLAAFGLTPEAVSDAQLSLLLTEDPEAQDSFAARQADTAFRDYARTMARVVVNPGVFDRIINGMDDAAPGEAVRISGAARMVAAYAARFPAAPAREIAAFGALAQQASSAADILGNRALADDTMRAMGLDPGAVSDATLAKLLTEDPYDPSSYAARQEDAAYAAYARAMAAWVGNAGQARRLESGIVDRWTTNAFEIAQETGGVRAALYFRRVIAGIGSVNELMSDKVLMEVVRGALGFGDSFAMMPFEQQQRALSRRIDFESFRDPKAVDRLAQRYLMTRQDAATTSPLVALFGGSGSASDITSLGMTLRLRA